MTGLVIAPDMTFQAFKPVESLVSFTQISVN
jgi:hypothetical protein